jgi:hypothetical protein
MAVRRWAAHPDGQVPGMSLTGLFGRSRDSGPRRWPSTGAINEDEWLGRRPFAQ